MKTDISVVFFNTIRTLKPYSIVAGNPAREIRKRFSKEQIESLEKSKWFLLPPDKLSSAFKYAQDLDKFLEEVGRIKGDSYE